MATALNAPIPSAKASKVRGKAERGSVPRTAHAVLADRPSTFDPIQILVAQGAGRVAELLPLRYARMDHDPFSFLRGAAAIMAADLAIGPATDLFVQLCGDAHLSNFGVFFSPERRLVFDIDDFDETHAGPFEWDVKRLVASIAVAAQGLRLTKGQQELAVFAAVQGYRNAMRLFSLAPTLEVWYAHLEVGSTLRLLEPTMSAKAQDTERVRDRVERSGARKAYAKLVIDAPDGPRIKSDPPLLVPARDLPADEQADAAGLAERALRSYEQTLPADMRHLVHQLTPIDVARKVVGVGSVGTRCYVLFLLGRDGNDPFFLQVKQAGTSVLEAHLPPCTPSTPGERVVTGQQLIQATPDPFLGWFDVPDATGDPRHFYVRQLYDGKASANVATFDAQRLRDYSATCGWTLAHAHARSGDRVAIASYLGSSDAFDRALASFALAYAARNLADHRALTDAIASGRIIASTP